MIHPVHILVTCRNPELFRAAEFVFDTIRVGFPNAPIFVEGNDLSYRHALAVIRRCREAGAIFKDNVSQQVHHCWIESLIEASDAPFYVCDTDVVFWKSCEEWTFENTPLAGRLIPRFYDQVTACITHSRLHTSLLYIDPAAVKRKSAKVLASLCVKSPFHIEPNLVFPQTSYLSGQAYFHDTASLLFNAIGGTPFTRAQLDYYDHLNCGTYIDLVQDRMTVACNLRRDHNQIFDNRELARGLWQQQERYYAKFAA